MAAAKPRPSPGDRGLLAGDAGVLGRSGDACPPAKSGSTASWSPRTPDGAPPLMVERAVRELERAGAAAVQIEDQVEEKRCGHRPNKRLAEPAEMEERIAPPVSAPASPRLRAAGPGGA